MPRTKEEHIVRVELRFDTRDPDDVAILAELQDEAKRGPAKGSVPEHIMDLLLHRYRARRGQDFLGALWVPGGTGVTPPAVLPAPAPPPPEEPEEPQPSESARKAAKAWKPRRQKP